MWPLLVLLAPCAAVAAAAVVHEIHSFAEIAALTSSEFRPNETLLLFDLDNTLMTPVTDVGSDQWFYCLYQARGTAPLQDAQVDHELVSLWNAVQHEIQVEPSEADLPQWIHQHQLSGFHAMALTARNFEMLDVSVRQLLSIGIQLRQHATTTECTTTTTTTTDCTTPTTEEDIVIAPERLGGREQARYSRGVLAVGESNVKAHALKAFFQHGHPPGHASHHIRKIVFVDDKRYHCDAMSQLELELLQGGLVHIESYRYGRLDERVRNFQCDVATTAQRFFGMESV